MLQTIVKVLKRFVGFILGGVAGFCLPVLFRTLLTTLGFVVPVILFALIYYKDKKDRIANFTYFLVGVVSGFALFWYVLILAFTEVLP